MKKSMGSKRNEISEEQINEIVCLYGGAQPNDYVKIFDNEDFGYSKITVERPVRLNFQVNEERLARVVVERGFANIATSKKKGDAGYFEIEDGKKLQSKILYVLRNLASDIVYKNRDEFTKVVKDALMQAGITAGAPVLKAVLVGLSEKDETADVCMKNKTEIEPDTDLRDTENIPLKENIHDYFEREVLSNVPDAWIDETKTKIGYEIPFTRQFYKYTALRSSAEIMDEIRKLEAEISMQLKKVLR